VAECRAGITLDEKRQKTNFIFYDAPWFGEDGKFIKNLRYIRLEGRAAGRVTPRTAYADGTSALPVLDKHLSRIEDAVGVEEPLDAFHYFEGGGVDGEGQI
jgi:hypothetical protein